jgi:hypothetical protein
MLIYLVFFWQLKNCSMGIVHLLILNTFPERDLAVDCNICYRGNVVSKENNEFNLDLILVG